MPWGTAEPAFQNQALLNFYAADVKLRDGAKDIQLAFL